MKVVLDTNVVLSGLLWDGICNQLIRFLLKNNVAILGSEGTIREFSKVIKYRKFSPRLKELSFAKEEVVVYYKNLVAFVPIIKKYEKKIPDPSDRMFLDVAINGQASLIVSGDNHLLKLENIEGIPIVSPDEAMRVLLEIFL